MSEDRFADIQNEKTIFDKACEEVDKEYYGNGDVSCENVIEFLRNSPIATVTFSQKRWITKIEKLADKYPGEFEIVHINHDGSIVAHIPVSSIKINKRPARVLTDEQKEAAKKRLMAARAKRFGDKDISEEELLDLEEELEDVFDDEE